ncbi:MAG: hypothetical protein LBK73_08920 [Treponema sp.]|jgi:hypothetical protein|nr:hypothetical protein [Treponema sp.]
MKKASGNCSGRMEMKAAGFAQPESAAAKSETFLFPKTRIFSKKSIDRIRIFLYTMRYAPVRPDILSRRKQGENYV